MFGKYGVSPLRFWDLLTESGAKSMTVFTFFVALPFAFFRLYQSITSTKKPQKGRDRLSEKALFTMQPCQDCAEIKAQLSAQKKFMGDWFGLVLKQLETVETETSQFRREVAGKLDLFESMIQQFNLSPPTAAEQEKQWDLPMP